jgi:hypothetical protein
MSQAHRIKRVLALGAVSMAAVAAASVGGAAATGAAGASEPAIDLGLTHGDPIEAAGVWSAAGAPLTVPLTAAQVCPIYNSHDDLANEVAQAGPRWHMIVAVPRDIANHANYENGGKAALYAQAVQSVKTLESFYKVRVGNGDIGQLPNQWTLRFDYGTACGAQFPDISVYHLPKTQSQYTNEPFFGVTADLDASNRFERSNKRYIVHYAGVSKYCGESYIYSPTDNTGGTKYSLTYNLHSLVTLGSTSVPCDWTTDAHEMGHSMGAATGGPQNLDGGHTWDCENDVMSYGGPTCGDSLLYYDFKENNYFGHSGSWYDTDRSAYWCKPNC